MLSDTPNTLHSTNLTKGTLSSFNQSNSDIVDLLQALPSKYSFNERVLNLGLTSQLERKIIDREASSPQHHLNKMDEKELASEVLLLRHRFTCLVFENTVFKQATLTVIQNIYLFKQRKIFFGTTDNLYEKERQEALLLFSQSPGNSSIPLNKTFQHLIIARVWNRIIQQIDDKLLNDKSFCELHDVVEKLNTLRNIYMLLTRGLVRKLTKNISPVYKQSITEEDAHQIGSFGIARAAYRYHPSTGQRFSTYAARWIKKEIQRQALQGRLIRISSGRIEMYSNAEQSGSSQEKQEAKNYLLKATPQFLSDKESIDTNLAKDSTNNPAKLHEEKEQEYQLLMAINETLSPKGRDIILRKYGMGRYKNNPQSVIEIADYYGVTRGSIYQLEQTALKKIRAYLEEDEGQSAHTCLLNTS